MPGIFSRYPRRRRLYGSPWVRRHPCAWERRPQHRYSPHGPNNRQNWCDSLMLPIKLNRQRQRIARSANKAPARRGCLFPALRRLAWRLAGPMARMHGSDLKYRHSNTLRRNHQSAPRSECRLPNLVRRRKQAHGAAPGSRRHLVGRRRRLCPRAATHTGGSMAGGTSPCGRERDASRILGDRR